MSVKVTDNSAEVNFKAKSNASLALRQITDDIIRISGPKTPRRSGDLRNRVLKQVLGLNAKVAWQTDYAIYQETKQFGHYTTPGTGPHFAENAVRTVVNNSNKYFGNLL